MKRILGVLILLGVYVGLPVAAYGWIGLLVVALALAIVGLLMLAARLLEVDR